MNLFGKKSGFTLSEVLITLTLIGFLATLTLSTVGSSVQQRTRLAEFRAAYAKMSTVLKNITVDQGRIYSCYGIPSDEYVEEFGLNIDGHLSANVASECATLEKEFVRAMGAVRYCENNPITEGCMPANYPLPPEAGSTCFSSSANRNAYILDNGVLIFTYNRLLGMRMFALDVNGRKGPNKWGQDIFPFEVDYTETKNVNGKIFVKEIGLLPYAVSSSCNYADGGATRSTAQMMKESSGIREPR